MIATMRRREFITLLGERSSRSAYLVLNFRDPAPPSPRGVLANATPRRFPFRLITRNLSSGIWPSAFSSFSKSALNVVSASTIVSKDFFTGRQIICIDVLPLQFFACHILLQLGKSTPQPSGRDMAGPIDLGVRHVKRARRRSS